MNCTSCKKTKLTPCNDCDYVVSTDCVEYQGDKLSFESSSIKNGSSRSLTDILNSFDDRECITRLPKVIESDYEIIEEDFCKILLLSGDSDTNTTYTITLPDSDEYLNQTLVFKDVANYENLSGVISWEFSETISFDKGNSSNKFKKLAWAPHKVLHLTFLKKDGVNSEWVVTSTSIGHPEIVTFADSDLEGDWEIVEELKLYRNGKHRQLQGMVTGGAVPSALLYLDAEDIPPTEGYFLAAVDASPYRALITISSFLSVSFPGGVALTSGENLSLFGISWYVE